MAVQREEWLFVSLLRRWCNIDDTKKHISIIDTELRRLLKLQQSFSVFKMEIDSTSRKLPQQARVVRPTSPNHQENLSLASQSNFHSSNRIFRIVSLQSYEVSYGADMLVRFISVSWRTQSRSQLSSLTNFNLFVMCNP